MIRVLPIIAIIHATNSHNAVVLEPAEIIQNMTDTKSVKSLSISPLAKPIKLDDLFDEETKKKLKKAKPSPEPTSAVFNLFPSAWGFAKPVPSPSPSPVKPASADLRGNDCPVISQWNGTCTAHGLAAAMENLLHCKVNLSERHLWSTYHEYNVKSALDGASLNNIVSDKIWPNTSELPINKLAPPTVKLVKYTYLGDSTDLLESHLSQGHPGYVGMSTPKELLTCKPVVSESSEVQPNSGHAMEVVGFQRSDKLKGGGYFIVKNSWSEACGDKGYQYVPYSFCQKPDAYCLFYSIEAVQSL